MTVVKIVRNLSPSMLPNHDNAQNTMVSKIVTMLFTVSSPSNLFFMSDLFLNVRKPVFTNFQSIFVYFLFLLRFVHSQFRVVVFIDTFFQLLYSVRCQLAATPHREHSSQQSGSGYNDRCYYFRIHSFITCQPLYANLYKQNRN
nr:MAG TPA: hypothetical protein [Caudoviricetes sp.]